MNPYTDYYEFDDGAVDEDIADIDAYIEAGGDPDAGFEAFNEWLKENRSPALV